MLQYMGVSLPMPLLNKIDEMRQKYQFSSRADFVKQACRREIERLEKRKENKEAKNGSEQIPTS